MADRGSGGGRSKKRVDDEALGVGVRRGTTVARPAGRRGEGGLERGRAVGGEGG